jgi:hypothetical protein
MIVMESQAHLDSANGTNSSRCFSAGWDERNGRIFRNGFPQPDLRSELQRAAVDRATRPTQAQSSVHSSAKQLPVFGLLIRGLAEFKNLAVAADKDLCPVRGQCGLCGRRVIDRVG